MKKQVSNLYMDAPILEPHMYTNTINGHLLSSQGNKHVSKENDLTGEITMLPQVCRYFNHNKNKNEDSSLNRVVITTK